ncbi:THOC6 [Bugula neritina]|uniref:THOC6 n=1 Tax=Bugula neritina TaxID=10212 RepID=A0A7J7K8J7_BUGNE|nr:THOC6 [Bugula neritina]
MLITGGCGKLIYQWNINGECKTQVPVSASTVYNISVNHGNPSKKMLTVAGAGHKVDACLNFGYTSFTYEL